MTTRDGESIEPELDSAAEQRIKNLLKDVIDGDEATGSDTAPRDLLVGVQHKLRVRSGGKFYEEGWSTARHAPVATYLITSLLMLAVIAVFYIVLQPLAGSPETVRNQPAPVEVIAPPRGSR
ncbi:MAG TPA: hypothetical protein VIV60_36990 [Polyangiaceae bacterium]